MKTIPLVNTIGEILTHDAWQKLGVTCLAYDLGALLMKPGLEVLLAQASLADYVGWPHQIVLDLSSLVVHKQRIMLRSRFDGARIQLSVDELQQLVAGLKPDWVKWPEGLMQGNECEHLIVTDEPLRLAAEGKVLIRQTVVELSSLQYQQVHEILDSSCQCETCLTPFTAAYLHHLFQAVPLLCQRLLGMHNCFTYFWA